MTIRGKSALRKKRLKGGPFLQRRVAASYSCPFAGWFSDALLSLCHQLVSQNPNVGQIAVALGEIEPVADHEAVRNLEADVAADDVVLASLGLRQKGAGFERRLRSPPRPRSSRWP